jgi:hypothetical protein
VAFTKIRICYFIYLFFPFFTMPHLMHRFLFDAADYLTILFIVQTFHGQPVGSYHQPLVLLRASELL